MTNPALEPLPHAEDNALRFSDFVDRHIGPRQGEIEQMLDALGVASLDALVDQTVPTAIRLRGRIDIGEGVSEETALAKLRAIASENVVLRSCLGMGYHPCLVPGVIQRNVLENPAWYTAYTPYQAEIAQGRLEALINFQTMVTDLTGLPVANASLLDEGTAAAEAMAICLASARGSRRRFFVDSGCHPQTLEVVETRAWALGVEVVTGDHRELVPDAELFGVLLQYPTSTGSIYDYEPLIERVHAAGALAVVAADPLALVLLRPPGEMGADIAVGSTQRFGVPMGFGGPHAAYMATRDELKRRLPGRVVGVSRDARGRVAYRLSLQTREQHIRREKATSNICTAQVLPAVLASMYAVYHGKEGLERIAGAVHAQARRLAAGLIERGHRLASEPFFDTLAVTVEGEPAAAAIDRAREHGYNLRSIDAQRIGIALDETTRDEDVDVLLEVFAWPMGAGPGGGARGATRRGPGAIGLPAIAPIASPHERTTSLLDHPVFNRYRSETAMLRYLHALAAKDLTLANSMIPLGSCTMKLNATAEMTPVTWPEFGALHPFAPAEQTRGYRRLIADLERMLGELTGFPAVSLQPNAGSQGELTGLLMIRRYLESRGEPERRVCLIPESAHGTNPASAVMAGLDVVVVACDDQGNVDLDDLEAKLAQHGDRLAALMITYPSTHGVFEESIVRICELVHARGGQVYMDGANFNAMVGLVRPGDFGVDVCHLNLHKTFCLAEGTPVALPSGTARRIEQLVAGRAVLAWSQGEAGVRGARLEAAFRTGRKACVEVTLQDGRTIICTPDHRVLTTDGWVEAGNLEPSCHRVVVGPEAPIDDPSADALAEQEFRATFGPLALSLGNTEQRDKSLAFFRLLGALCSDGSYVEQKDGRAIARLNFGTRYDAARAVEDIFLLVGVRPAISRSRSVFSVRLPAPLVRAVAGVPGIGPPGPRVASRRCLPDFVDDARTPLAVLREFLAGLFGGDGCAPVILHLRANPATLKPVRFSQSRLDPEVLQAMQGQLCGALARLGVAATPDRLARPRHQRAKDLALPRWVGGVTIVDGLAFAERVGFRYCAHKSARLTAAAAYWRMKRKVRRERADVATRALARVAATGRARLGPKPVWTTAVAEAYQELAAEQVVVNGYYASFAGSARLSRQHLVLAVQGARGTRPGILGVRRTNRRVLAASVGRGGQQTGVLGLTEFLAQVGAAAWFNGHTPRGGSYNVTYAVSQEATVEPTLTLGVLDVRPCGDREVHDLTVNELHSFLANGAVVHNCIPHGGGGPGMGPVAAGAHLGPHLPGHRVIGLGGSESVGAVSAAPWGSPSILPISWMYITMMGGAGLKRASQVAILNANYIAGKLDSAFPVLFRGRGGRVAHECILDLRPLKKSAGVEVEDVAKRLMDYGFHAPTVSWPVPGTVMVEPTESESKEELDRFCAAMLAIREEARAIERGELPVEGSPLRHAPHPAEDLLAASWDRPYSREAAAYPAPWTRDHKYWPPVARIDNAWGDRNLVCTCPPIEEYAAD